MFNLSSFPSELNTLTFLRLDPSSLQQVSRVCKKWNTTINQETFFKTYAQTRSKYDMENLTFEFFHSLIPFFEPQQLFHVDGKKIKRDLIQLFPENENNRVNLKIVKLISSLGCYKKISDTKVNIFIEQWHPRDPSSAQKFRESCEYIYLLVIGTSLEFIHNRADKYKEEFIEKYRDYKITDKSELEDVEERIFLDYISLNLADREILEQAFQAVFCKYKISHIMCPRGGEKGFFKLPDVFFKGFFTALTNQFLEDEEDRIVSIAPKPNDSLLGSLLGYLPFSLNGYFKTSSTTETSINSYKNLNIGIKNDEQLRLLIKWLNTTKVAIKTLRLDLGHIGYSDEFFTEESFKKLKEIQSELKVESIEFHGDIVNREIFTLCQEIGFVH